MFFFCWPIFEYLLSFKKFEHHFLVQVTFSDSRVPSVFRQPRANDSTLFFPCLFAFFRFSQQANVSCQIPSGRARGGQQMVSSHHLTQLAPYAVNCPEQPETPSSRRPSRGCSGRRFEDRSKGTRVLHGARRCQLDRVGQSDTYEPTPYPIYTTRVPQQQTSTIHATPPAIKGEGPRTPGELFLYSGPTVLQLCTHLLLLLHISDLESKLPIRCAHVHGQREIGGSVRSPRRVSFRPAEYAHTRVCLFSQSSAISENPKKTATRS